MVNLYLMLTTITTENMTKYCVFYEKMIIIANVLIMIIVSEILQSFPVTAHRTCTLKSMPNSVKSDVLSPVCQGEETIQCNYDLLLHLGMYQIAIFKIRPEPESTGYQMNYPTGTGYL